MDLNVCRNVTFVAGRLMSGFAGDELLDLNTGASVSFTGSVSDAKIAVTNLSDFSSISGSGDGQNYNLTYKNGHECNVDLTVSGLEFQAIDLTTLSCIEGKLDERSIPVFDETARTLNIYIIMQSQTPFTRF